MNETTQRVIRGQLSVAVELDELATQRLLPGLALSAEKFWGTLASLVAEFSTRNRQLLEHRSELQAQIDRWNEAHRGDKFSPDAYELFLRQIGYLQPAPSSFQVSVRDVDPEIATLAGPQLVVPVSNARYALNAANARWGSLYDALYGTNAIPGDPVSSDGKYDPVRGAQVVAWAKSFLDRAVPLVNGSHQEAVAYAVKDGQLHVSFAQGRGSQLRSGTELAGWKGSLRTPPPFCCATTDCTSNFGSTVRTQLGRAIPRA